MTLTSIRNSLLEILAHQDVLTPSDFAEVEIDPEVEDQREALIRSVLGDLVEAGILRAIPASADVHSVDNSMWILTAPLGVAGQQVPVSLPTAIHIASEINAYREGCDMEDEWPAADALNLGEHHVLMLLAIIGHFRSNDFTEEGDDRN